MGSIEDWRPTAQELPYFEQLFTAALGGDPSINTSTAELGGVAAVAFFVKSKLDKPLLKQIWAASNLRNGPSLNKREFCIAMRLVAMIQSNSSLPVTRDAFIASMQQSLPLPRFEGIPLPSTVTLSTTNPSSSLPPTIPVLSNTSPSVSYAISSTDQAKYDTIFASQDTDHDGFVDANTAVELFTKSGLDKSILKLIWSLSDIDNDKRLDHDEFSIAMHLVVGASKRGMAVPSSLPNELIPPSKQSYFPNNNLINTSTTARRQSVGMMVPLAVSVNPSPPAPLRVDDAFSNMDIPSVVTVPPPTLSTPPVVVPVVVPAPAPVPVPAPAPIPVPAPAPVPVPAPASLPTVPPAVNTPSLPPRRGSFAPVPAPAPVATVPSPSYVTVPPTVSSSSASLSTPSSSIPSSSSSAVAQPLLSTASELEDAMRSHLRKENSALEMRNEWLSDTLNELKRLEGERAIFHKQIETVRNLITQEEQEYATTVNRIQVLRAEIQKARSTEATLTASLADQRRTTAESKGVLASLATTLVTLTGKKDTLEKDVRTLLETVLGNELHALQAMNTATTLNTVADTHAAAADVNEAETQALRSAIQEIEQRIQTLQHEKTNVQNRVNTSNQKLTENKSLIHSAEQRVNHERERHETSITNKVVAKQAHIDALASLQAMEHEVTHAYVSHADTMNVPVSEPSFTAPSIAKAETPVAVTVPPSLPSKRTVDTVPVPVPAPVPVIVPTPAPVSSAFNDDFAFNASPSAIDETSFPTTAVVSSSSTNAFADDFSFGGGSTTVAAPSPPTATDNEDTFGTDFGVSPKDHSSEPVTTNNGSTNLDDSFGFGLSSSSSSSSGANAVPTATTIDDGFDSPSFDQPRTTAVGSKVTATVSNDVDDDAFNFSSTPAPAPVAVVANTKIAPAPAPSNTMDDFGSFGDFGNDAFGSTNSSGTSSQHTVSSSSVGFDDDFASAFNATPAPAPSASTNKSATNSVPPAQNSFTWDF